jgi:Tfp pilus assembly protein PilO
VNSAWRGVIARAIILGACVVGAWAVVLAPMRAELARAESRLERARKESTRAQHLAERTQAVTAAMERSRAELARIDAQGEAARDPARLFELVSAIGAREGVVIHHMQPARSASAGKDGAEGDSEVSYEIEATGAYEAIAGFLGAVESEAGLTTIEGLSLRPVSGQPGVVRAGVRTRHFCFATPTPEQLLAEVEARREGVER